MSAWIIKSETYDPDRALEILRDQRSKGNNAWLEDENGAAVDERPLSINGGAAIKPTFFERFTGPLFVLASVVAGIFVVYLIGLWVDSY